MFLVEFPCCFGYHQSCWLNRFVDLFETRLEVVIISYYERVKRKWLGGIEKRMGKKIEDSEPRDQLSYGCVTHWNEDCHQKIDNHIFGPPCKQFMLFWTSSSLYQSLVISATEPWTHTILSQWSAKTPVASKGSCPENAGWQQGKKAHLYTTVLNTIHLITFPRKDYLVGFHLPVCQQREAAHHMQREVKSFSSIKICTRAHTPDTPVKYKPQLKQYALTIFQSKKS